MTRAFEKGFLRLELETRRRVDASIRSFETDPHRGKLLRGSLTRMWSLRVGDYSIMYGTDEREKTVTLYAMGHRKTVYR